MNNINKEFCILLIKRYLKENNSKYLLSLKMELLAILEDKYFYNYDSSYYIEEGKPEAIEVIKNTLGDNFKYFLAGNIIKYIKRYGLKDVENKHFDLIKAKNYLNFILKEYHKKEYDKYKIFRT